MYTPTMSSDERLGLVGAPPPRCSESGSELAPSPRDWLSR
jgi:hypothetical protein